MSDTAVYYCVKVQQNDMSFLNGIFLKIKGPLPDITAVIQRLPPQPSCAYSFSKNISSSDAGTYYCAVASCGEILFGNGTKLDIEGTNMCAFGDSQVAILLLLSTALAISVIVTTFLIYTIKKKSCDCCKAASNSQQTNAATTSSGPQNQTDELVYSAAVFTRTRAGSGGERCVTAAEKESIYNEVL
ncbi:hypothetical protein LDENG_00271130 [Lucifuga dentata]|nr:hypothetical protein LDENG_00271130 [Lucifuga dentata]